MNCKTKTYSNCNCNTWHAKEFREWQSWEENEGLRNKGQTENGHEGRVSFDIFFCVLYCKTMENIIQMPNVYSFRWGHFEFRNQETKELLYRVRCGNDSNRKKEEILFNWIDCSFSCIWFCNLLWQINCMRDKLQEKNKTWRFTYPIINTVKPYRTYINWQNCRIYRKRSPLSGADGKCF